MTSTTFIMEQQVGHQTFYKNLRRFIERKPDLETAWAEVTYKNPDNVWERLPLVPNGIRGPLVGRSQVRDAITQRPADVFFFNTQALGALAGGKIGKRPYILCTDITPIQYDDMGEYYGHQPDSNPILSRYKHNVNLKLFKNAAHIIPWSSWTGKSLIEDYHVAPEQITIIPPGVDTAVWKPAEKQETAEKPMRILFIGGDFYRKGGELLLRAFNALPPGSAELILVTRSTIETSEHVHVYNNMSANSPELIALSQSCDVFVLPTRAEAFGIAAVEASAMGLPVIGTAVGGLTDVVKHQKTGYIIDVDDLDSLTDYLTQLSQNSELRHQLGYNARQHVENNFDARKNANQIITIIKEVSQNHKK